MVGRRSRFRRVGADERLNEFAEEHARTRARERARDDECGDAVPRDRDGGRGQEPVLHDHRGSGRPHPSSRGARRADAPGATGGAEGCQAWLQEGCGKGNRRRARERRPRRVHRDRTNRRGRVRGPVEDRRSSCFGVIRTCSCSCTRRRHLGARTGCLRPRRSSGAGRVAGRRRACSSRSCRARRNGPQRDPADVVCRTCASSTGARGAGACSGRAGRTGRIVGRHRGTAQDRQHAPGTTGSEPSQLGRRSAARTATGHRCVVGLVRHVVAADLVRARTDGATADERAARRIAPACSGRGGACRAERPCRVRTGCGCAACASHVVVRSSDPAAARHGSARFGVGSSDPAAARQCSPAGASGSSRRWRRWVRPALRPW